MNLPNRLTLIRIGLTFVMTVLLTFPSIPFGKTIALLVFVVASVTDYWDGRLARRWSQVTAFGKLMDPLADKILVCSAFVGFVAVRQIVPAWVVITIISREFLITGLRLLAANSGRILQASALGKHKTVWQIIVIVTIMVGLALREDVFPRLPELAWLEVIVRYFNQYFDLLAIGLVAVAAVLTVVSGMVYLYENRRLFLSES